MSGTSRKLRVYLSFSRNDTAFADQLHAALASLGFEVVIDRHSILGGEDWKHRLVSMINECDTVVFVLSPHALNSEICRWETNEAVNRGKRIIPVLCAPVEAALVPEELKVLNFIYLYAEPSSPNSGFGVGLAALRDALNQDVSWIQHFTRLTALAGEWDSGARRNNLLLRGPDLVDAKRWLDGRPPSAPEPTRLVRDYIAASSMEAEQSRPAIQQATPKPRGCRIFISYRRKDTPHVAGRICDRLEKDFSTEDVFFDVDKIPLGSRFRDVITDCLHQSAILLIVIGEQWPNPRWSRSKLSQLFREADEDYVQTEIELALQLGLPIVPVLVSDTKIPTRRKLPKSIAGICDLHAASVRAGRDFHIDMSTICVMVKELRSNL